GCRDLPKGKRGRAIGGLKVPATPCQQGTFLGPSRAGAREAWNRWYDRVAAVLPQSQVPLPAARELDLRRVPAGPFAGPQLPGGWNARDHRGLRRACVDSAGRLLRGSEGRPRRDGP